MDTTSRPKGRRPGRSVELDPAKVREAREARGLDQGELARLAGVSDKQISAIERGRTHPSPKTAAALAKHLRRDLDALRPGTVPAP